MIEQHIPQEKSRYFAVLKEAVRYYGLILKRVTPDGVIYEVSNGQKSFRFNLSATEKNSAILRKIAQNKLLTVKVLGELGFAVPHSKVVKDLRGAKIFLQKRKNIVIKPIDGSLGNGITIGIKKEKELKKAFVLAQRFSKSGEVIVEEFIKGKDFRITIINGKDYFVAQRVPAGVVGDGKRSIKELIEKENRQREEKNKLLIDEVTEQEIFEQGFFYDTIPNKEQFIRLRKNANISTGGIGIDQTEKINKKVIKELIFLTKILRAGTVGIDILTEDITSEKYKIIEINTRPQMMSHHFPHIGQKRYPARSIMKMLFPELVD